MGQKIATVGLNVLTSSWEAEETRRQNQIVWRLGVHHAPRCMK